MWLRRGGEQGELTYREDEQQANFLELFVDLVLVFALSGVVSRVVPDITGGAQWRSLAYLLVLTMPLIWLWVTTGHITSRFDHRRSIIQWIVLASAFGLLVMALSLPQATANHGLAFVLPYVLLHCVRPLILLPRLRDHALRQLYLRMTLWCLGTAVIWIAGAAVNGSARIALWAVAVTLDLVAGQLLWPLPGMARQPISAWATERARHLPERYQQLLMIALGETVLAAGIAFTSQPITPAATVALLVAYLTTVLLWRIYFYRSGQVLAEAVAAAGDRLAAGRATGNSHIVMVVGIVATAVGSEIALRHPAGRPALVWLVVILGGPMLFLYGRIRLERVVFDRLSRRRIVAIVVILAAAIPLQRATSLIATTTSAIVLLGVALADAKHASNRPPEEPSPAH